MRSGKQRCVFHCSRESGQKHRGPVSFQKRLLRVEQQEPEHVISMLRAFQKQSCGVGFPASFYRRREVSSGGPLEKFPFEQRVRHPPSFRSARQVIFTSQGGRVSEIYEGFFVFRVQTISQIHLEKLSSVFMPSRFFFFPESVKVRAGG